jgi:hypothetical protein
LYSGFFKVGLHSHPDTSFQWRPGSIENTKVAAKLANLSENLSAESAFPLLTDGATRASEIAPMTSLAASGIAANATNSTLDNKVQIPKRELLPGIKARPYKNSFSRGSLWITTVP